MEVVVLRKPEITEILIKRDEYKKYKNWKKKIDYSWKEK